MLRQTHFTFTLAKLRLLQVGLRDLPYRLLTQAASVEPRSSKSAGRTRANRTGSTSSRGGAPRAGSGRLPVFSPARCAATPCVHPHPASARPAHQEPVSNAPPTKFAGSADSAMPKADTYPARESVRDGRTKRRVLEDRDRRTAEQRAAAAARKTASIHAASRIPSTQELHSRPAKVPVPRAPKKRKALRLTATRR